MRTAFFRPSEGSLFPSEGRSFFFPRAIRFPSGEGKFSCLGKNIFQAWKTNFPTWENFPPSAGKNDAVRKAKKIRAHRKKIPHMRKYFFVYAEIFFRICAVFSPCPLGGNGTGKGSLAEGSRALALRALRHGGYCRRRGRGGLLTLGLGDVREGFADEDPSLVPKEATLEVHEGFPSLRTRFG